MDQNTQNPPSTPAPAPQEPVKIGITLPTNAYFMSGIRDFTLSMIKNMTQFSEQWAYRFQSVVDELCNNAIEHGSARGHDIMVTFIQNPQDQSIEIIVDDSGTGKDKITAALLKGIVEERTKPEYSFKSIRGRGLAKIVSAWSDELEFTDLPNGGIRTRVKKYLNNPALQQAVPGVSVDPTHVLLTI
ncbi:ATP-binding protein [Candidatus Gracilibacteria bacterium]|nr:ATP-binding protein [Candidatus Gracilibacteria bacterium]